MIRFLLAALIGCLAIAEPAASAGSAAPEAPANARSSARTVDLPRLFRRELRAVKRRTRVAVLLPQSLRSDFERHYPAGAATRRRWRLDIGAVRDCNSATACFVASFEARRGGRPRGDVRVALARGRVGFFTPMTCGASCSPPSIQWRERGALYVIFAKVGTAETEQQMLVDMANSAIRRGRR